MQTLPNKIRLDSAMNQTPSDSTCTEEQMERISEQGWANGASCSSRLGVGEEPCGEGVSQSEREGLLSEREGLLSEREDIQSEREGLSCVDGDYDPQPEHDPKELGRRGEKAAVNFLKRQGYEILETNWSCFAGEADIIAREGDVLCFVEVKTRSNTEHGFPSEAVNAKKRDRYERIAACYLKDYDTVDVSVRFDIISILVLSEHRAFLRFHINAFGID